MTIAAGDLKKIDVDLTKTSLLEFDYYLPIAKDGNPPLAITTGDLLRFRPNLVVDGTGGGTEVIDFTGDTFVQVTIDQDTIIDIDNVRPYETVYLLVLKGTTDIATFIGDLSFQEVAGSQYGRSKILYEITTASTSTTILKQVNSQRSGSITAGNLSITNATIADLLYFNYDINDNICTVNCKVDIEATASIDDVAITISNLKLYMNSSSSILACLATSIDVSTIYATQGNMVAAVSPVTITAVNVSLSESLGISDTATIQFTGSFEVI